MVFGGLCLDKYDYIEGIITFLKGITGINYQLQIGKILTKYYKKLGKTYEMPDFYGGDRKNDGWVVEDAIFYQVFAPTRLKESLKKEIQDKFEKDLKGLLEIIYENQEWGGILKEFIFIVNTFDTNLPQDSERFFDSVVDRLKNQYKINFFYRVVNTEYIREILEDIDDIEVLKQISTVLHVKGMIDFNAITETLIIDLIIKISSNLNDKFMGSVEDISYDRISTIKKIEINNLGEKKQEIEKIISNLDVVERAVNHINQEITFEDKFERVRDCVITKYNILAKKEQGIELYEELVREMLIYSNNDWNLENAMRFLIVYIFDKCDIFEKE